MPTRRDLHAQARQAQRHQLQAAKADNPKSAIVGIGARDPQTGLFDVLLPDGSTELGEKTFNSALPQGSQVLGIPKESGGWVLDERDVAPSPIAPVVVEPKGKIKYLYIKLATDGRVLLYVGGWKRQPVLVNTFEPGEFQAANLDNLGGDRWRVDAIVSNGSYRFQTFMGRESTVIDIPPPNVGRRFYGFGLALISYDQQIATNQPNPDTVIQTITTQTAYVVDGMVRQSSGSGVSLTVAGSGNTTNFSEGGIPLSNDLSYTQTFESFSNAGGAGGSSYSVGVARSNGDQSIGVLTTGVNDGRLMHPCWIDGAVQPISTTDYDFSGSLDVQKNGFTRFVLGATFPENKDQVVEVEQYDKTFVKSAKTIKTKVLKPPTGIQIFSPSYHR